MQNRYTGDIGDYVKYGLLRKLAEGQRLGVAWYLFPDESNTGDGSHTEYLKRPGCWRKRDPELFDALERIVEEGRRSVAAIECSGILVNAKFSNEILSAPKPMCRPAKYPQRREWRSLWFEKVRDTLRECNVVFADPDNGLCEDDKFRSGTVKCWKRLPLHEAKMLAEGRAVVIYHHNTRFKGGHRKEIERWMGRLGPDALALYWRAWSNRTFFIVNSPSDMKERLSRFVRTWGPEAELIGSGNQ